MPKMSEEDVKGIDVVLQGMAVFILDLERNKAAYLASDHALAQVFGTVVHRQAAVQEPPLSAQQRRVLAATLDRVLEIVRANQPPPETSN